MCSKHAQQRAAGIIDEEGNQLREFEEWRKKGKPGPTLDGRGYVLVRAPAGYKGTTRDGRVLEHRLVMEQKLGRLLHGRESEFYEIVHHIDGNIQNNDISNLEIYLFNEHPPGHVVPTEQLRLIVEALQHNDPEAFAELLAFMKEKEKNR